MEFKNDSDYLDQHFLIDQKVINKFIDVANFSKKDVVVEVGPGSGNLTKVIAPKVKALTCIEKDERLSTFLDKIPDIKVIYGDVITYDLPPCDKIITSLPYSIIEPFMYKMTKTNFKELYMIMGSTYVNNVLNKEITNLSLLTNTYFNLEKIMDITPESFNPKPKTMSSMIKIIPKREFTKEEIIIKYLYELDAKKVKNDLKEAFIKYYHFTKKESLIIINNLNIEENILNKEFRLLSNEELKIIYQKIFSYFNK